MVVLATVAPLLAAVLVVVPVLWHWWHRLVLPVLVPPRDGGWWVAVAVVVPVVCHLRYQWYRPILLAVAASTASGSSVPVVSQLRYQKAYRGLGQQTGAPPTETCAARCVATSFSAVASFAATLGPHWSAIDATRLSSALEGAHNFRNAKHCCMLAGLAPLRTPLRTPLRGPSRRP